MAPPLRDIFQASHLAQQANRLSASAYLAAIRCDAEAARRLAARAAAIVPVARRLINRAPAAARNFYATDDATLRLLDSVERELGRIDTLLRRCRPERRHPFRKGGSFRRSRGELNGHERKNKIKFVFDLVRNVQCEKLCIVSVYHIEEDATGAVVDPPSKAYRDGYDPIFYGGPVDDKDAYMGYVVDTPPKKLVGAQLVPNTDPCMPTMKIVGRRITAEDQPAFLKPGFTAYFETCVLCMDKKDFTVLGCMRWSHASGLSKILPAPGGGTDWGNASSNFNAAVRTWLRNH